MVAFYTEHGLGVPAVTADQMREIDRIAMEDTSPNLFQMMENAGRNLASLTMELLDDPGNQKIVILAGSGGNGGGGICAARHLANRNLDVTLCLSNPEKLGEVPRFQYKIYQHTAGHEIQANELANKKFDLIIDALIGYSLKGAPTGITAELIRWANQANTPILSLDVPSGVNSTSGETPGDFIRARWTMTLALSKTGHGKEQHQEIFLADIGVPKQAYNQIGIKYPPPFGEDFCIRVFTCKTSEVYAFLPTNKRDIAPHSNSSLIFIRNIFIFTP